MAINKLTVDHLPVAIGAAFDRARYERTADAVAEAVLEAAAYYRIDTSDPAAAIRELIGKGLVSENFDLVLGMLDQVDGDVALEVVALLLRSLFEIPYAVYELSRRGLSRH